MHLSFPVFFLLVLLLSACGGGASEATVTSSDSISAQAVAGEVLNNDAPSADVEADDNYADFFVLVADTGTDYWLLHEKMNTLQQKTGWNIDTMNRYYNSDKDKIVLHEDDEDEMYAGDYFPRRFPSPDISLEYYAVYSPAAGEKTIALVAGIFQDKQDADKAFDRLKAHSANSVLLKSALYVGCMH